MDTDIQNIGKKSVRSMTAFLKRMGCVPCKGHYGQHYHYHSGFFTSPYGKLWYWMSSDDRLSWGGEGRVLVRTANDLRDYTGGYNQYPRTEAEFNALMANDIRRNTDGENANGAA